jgi:type III restriction enzyme
VLGDFRGGVKLARDFAMDDPIVLAKASAATKWCKTANTCAKADGGRMWGYVLVADDQIIGAATLDGLVAKFSR